ncbi:MAG: hypothetical protein K2K27_08835 [Muribaculaceae bacterium]|nr:hypothetical protein [Muribaculaceae bacterium]
MNRLQSILSVVAIVLTITVPSISAQSRGAQSRRANTYSTNGRSSLGSNSGLSASGQRPGAGGHNNPTNSELNKEQQQHNNNHGTVAGNGSNTGRPGTNGQRPGIADRPENRPNQSTVANSWNVGGSPNHNSAPKPPVNNLGPVRPSNPHAPNYGGQNNMAAHRPGLNVPPPPPHRPLAPAFNANHFRRPLAPPSVFRPRYHINPLQSILGFTYGTALAASLNALNRVGCQIDGYANNSIYLRNVSAMNYMWPYATLYYNNGYLTASSFSYSTPRYDLTRYNSLFAHLSNMYGAPAAVSNGHDSMSATWWGFDNQYVTLSVQRQKSIGGTLRYYTSLTMGN